MKARISSGVVIFSPRSTNGILVACRARRDHRHAHASPLSPTLRCCPMRWRTRLLRSNQSCRLGEPASATAAVVFSAKTFRTTVFPAVPASRCTTNGVARHRVHRDQVEEEILSDLQPTCTVTVEVAVLHRDVIRREDTPTGSSSPRSHRSCRPRTSRRIVYLDTDGVALSDDVVGQSARAQYQPSSRGSLLSSKRIRACAHGGREVHALCPTNPPRRSVHGCQRRRTTTRSHHSPYRSHGE